MRASGASALTETRPIFGLELGRGWTKSIHSSICVDALGRSLCLFRPKTDARRQYAFGLIGVALTTRPTIHTHYGVRNFFLKDPAKLLA